jgi:hypothetical protein
MGDGIIMDKTEEKFRELLAKYIRTKRPDYFDKIVQEVVDATMKYGKKFDRDMVWFCIASLLEEKDIEIHKSTTG